MIPRMTHYRIVEKIATDEHKQRHVKTIYSHEQRVIKETIILINKRAILYIMTEDY